MLPPLFCSFSVHFAQKYRFQQKLLLYRLFKISLISVVRSLDKVCDLPKHGRENKKGDPSVDVIDSLEMFDTCQSNLLQFLERICGQDKLLRPIFEQLEHHISMLSQRHSF